MCSSQWLAETENKKLPKAADTRVIGEGINRARESPKLNPKYEVEQWHVLRYGGLYFWRSAIPLLPNSVIHLVTRETSRVKLFLNRFKFTRHSTTLEFHWSSISSLTKRKRAQTL